MRKKLLLLLALAAPMLGGCHTTGHHVAKGAVIGAVVGGVIGAVTSDHHHHRGHRHHHSRGHHHHGYRYCR